MAVYGDQLAFFGEQFRTATYFSMPVEITGGFGKRTEIGKVRGVLQYMKRGELYRENDALSDVSVPTFWTRKKLEVGNFLVMPDDEDTYRITNAQPWRHEGGFYVYVLETVSGNDGTEEAHDDVQLGTGEYW